MASTPLILGHRGNSALAPENTLAAFSRALLDGADGIEFDVRLSRDGLPVVIHDATLKRTGLLDQAVSSLTAAELQKIDVGSWFNHRAQNDQTFADERVPLLTQVFELFADNRALLYVEMKCDRDEGAALAAEVARLSRASGMADRVVVESFDLNAIEAIKKTDVGIRTAALFEPKLSRPVSTLRRSKMIETALGVQADEIALHHTLAGPRVIEKAKEAGLEVVVWTVDEPQWITRAQSLGIKAVIANNPAPLVSYRNSLRSLVS